MTELSVATMSITSTSAISLAMSAFASDNSRLRKHVSAAAPAQGVAVAFFSFRKGQFLESLYVLNRDGFPSDAHQAQVGLFGE